MQTAVEFLLSHMWTTDWVNYTREQKLNVIQQAKAMEKEQILNAFENGEVCTLFKNEDTSEQYYNKTFKSE
jgi:hypothetical protein